MYYVACPFSIQNSLKSEFFRNLLLLMDRMSARCKVSAHKGQKLENSKNNMEQLEQANRNGFGRFGLFYRKINDMNMERSIFGGTPLSDSSHIFYKERQWNRSFS